MKSTIATFRFVFLTLSYYWQDGLLFLSLVSFRRLFNTVYFLKIQGLKERKFLHGLLNNSFPCQRLQIQNTGENRYFSGNTSNRGLLAAMRFGLLHTQLRVKTRNSAQS